LKVGAFGLVTALLYSLAGVVRISTIVEVVRGAAVTPGARPA
jgi:hypothetical protein